MRLRAENIVSAEDVDADGTTRVVYAVNRVLYVPPDAENRERRELTRWVTELAGSITPYSP